MIKGEWKRNESTKNEKKRDSVKLKRFQQHKKKREEDMINE